MADPLEYEQIRHRDDSRVKKVMKKKRGLREDQLLHEYGGGMPALPPEAERASPAEPSAPKALDNVHFTLTGPNVLAPAQVHELMFWVHVEQQKAEVRLRASTAHRLTS
jgi:hypothetical protein